MNKNEVVIPVEPEIDKKSSDTVELTGITTQKETKISNNSLTSEVRQEQEQEQESEEEDEEDDSDAEAEAELNTLRGLKFGYRDVDEMLKDAFNYKEANNSMICDIIAMYLKGQKILYTEAKTLCEQRLNMLMLPTICITAICTVMSIALKEYPFSSTIISSLNALNFFFLTLINYLKLDAKAEAHRVAAYKFDKIQSRLEFSSGKILFIVGESKELPKIINDTEKDVREIKETNQFILPESIRYNYPRLTNINVFAEVKKIQTLETNLINKLKEVLNDHLELNIKIKSSANPLPNDEYKLQLLDEKKNMLTKKIIKIKDMYLEIDEQFEKEMREQREKLRRQFQICGCLKT